MASSRDIRFSTSFKSKSTMSIQCTKFAVETDFNVRIVIESNEFDTTKRHYNIDIYGRDEDRVVKAFITIVNEFPTMFSSENMNMPFPTSITTFDKILEHPRSFGMGFSWCKPM